MTTTMLNRTDAEWRRQLTQEQFQVTRCRGTEPASTGRFCEFDHAGVYRCVCCGSALFSSRDKVPSRRSWPAFRAPIVEENVALRPESFLLVRRQEAVCSTCNAHLGYLVSDGRTPPGGRYLINSLALTFEYLRDAPDTFCRRMTAAVEHTAA